MSESSPPRVIQILAARTVDQVRAAVGMELAYDSETLPVIDHYLRGVPPEQTETVWLIAVTAGAYFGEVVRRALGGEWELEEADQPMDARLILPSGLSFSPAGLAAAAILETDDLEMLDTGFRASEALTPHLHAVLERMSPVSTAEYFSLSGRFDTLEHLQEMVMVRVAKE